jgi:signal transduction histidine kinase
VGCRPFEVIRRRSSSSRWSSGVIHETDAPTGEVAYARPVDVSVVRRVLGASRPMDWLLVASLLLLAWFEIWVEPIFQTGMPGPRLPLTLLAAVALVPLLVRRVFPLAALAVICLGMLAVGVVGDADQSTFVLLLGLLVGVYSSAVFATPRNAVVGAAVVVVAMIGFQAMTFADKTLVDALVPALFLAAAFVGGQQVHRQHQRASELAERAALLARTHELELHAAVSAERTRIARELHDVVAHTISVMGIQAGAARRTLAAGQEAQQEALLDVERLGREALDEMQRMLGVLRTGEGDRRTRPLPDLTQLPGLVADARTTGLDVRLDLEDDLDRLPAGLQLTVYRVVQEALTNIRKHAVASSASVTIRRCDEGLEVGVVDDGNGGEGVPESGNGLIGMRERVAIHHGTLYAGARDERGFLVRARLPITAER